MNLYNLHISPESLPLFVEASEVIPVLFWAKYENNPEELKKREVAIATDMQYAYWYAKYVLSGPFPAGESEIAKDAYYALEYARYALKGPFPAGEAAISRSGVYRRYYANDVLKADFYLNGKLIAKYEK